MRKIKHLLYYLIPYIFGLLIFGVFAFLNIKYKIYYYNIKGFKDVLGSFVNFVSIVIGFYSAFYAIIVSVNKSSFFTILEKSEYKNVLPIELFLALISAFLTLSFTIILQMLINYKLWISYLIYFCWTFIIGVFMAYAFLISVLFISVIFYSTPVNEEPEDV